MFHEIEEETDVNRDWQKLRQVMLQAATEFKLSKDAKNGNTWWDEECNRAVQEKNEGRGKMSNKKNMNRLGYLSSKKNKSKYNL